MGRHAIVWLAHLYLRLVQAQVEVRIVCDTSLIPRYEWLPAFDDSHRTPN